jgi:hypothetical protein
MHADFRALKARGEDYGRQRKHVSKFFDTIERTVQTAEIPSLKLLDKGENFLRLEFLGRRHLIKHDFRLGKVRETASSVITRYLQDDFDDEKRESQATITIDWRGNVTVGSHQYVIDDAEDCSYAVLALLDPE